VRPGLYREALVLETPLEIMGEGQPGEIVVEFSNNDVVRFNTVFGRVVNLTLRQMGREEFYAVNVAQGRLELEGCDITSQSLACIIVLNGADPRVRRNLIHNGAKYGIYVCQFGRGTFENNQIFQNAFGGVVIESEGDPAFRRNQIYSNSWVYIIRNSGRGELEENDIFSNSQSGVVITAQSYPILARNRIYNNTEVGIYIYDNSGGRFENNDLRGNGTGATYVDESCTYNIQESGNIAE
jgi:F-box protein 11